MSEDYYTYEYSKHRDQWEIIYVPKGRMNTILIGVVNNEKHGRRITQELNGLLSDANETRELREDCWPNNSGV